MHGILSFFAGPYPQIVFASYGMVFEVVDRITWPSFLNGEYKEITLI